MKVGTIINLCMGHGDYRDFEVTPEGLVEVVKPIVPLVPPSDPLELFAFRLAQRLDLEMREALDKV